MAGDVVIIGAGLAGLSTAVHLTNKGIAPTVLEANPFVGGRTASWQEKTMQVETGLHRFLGFYSHLPRLLKAAGIDPEHILAWEDEIEIRVPNGPRAVLGLSPLFKPLKTLGGILGNNAFLSPKDKLSLARFFIVGTKDYLMRPATLDTKTVLQYAQDLRVTKRAIKHVLIPLTEGIFFVPITSYSAFVLFSLFVPYWNRLLALRVGAFTGGMTDVMTEPLATYVRSNGGCVLSNHSATRIIKRKRDFVVECTRGAFVANTVVLATSLGPAQRIIRGSFTHDWFTPMLALPSMPSVTFQMELTEPSLPVDRTTFGPLTCLSSFAEQSRTTFKGTTGRLSVILSPPEAFVHVPQDAILERVITDAEKLGMRLRGKILQYQKVVIPDDFYRLSPGSESLRPSQRTPINGFYLAGDYTKQRYVATMEGAVYSGELCARYILD
ncbi:MAG TPA: FAD-dependent oxidoreductase [Candidatus Saccharimonadales bacterium]|nr:FAD-dependent oxidoreductase [Candidatus Saccharimonadales bacterium]